MTLNQTSSVIINLPVTPQVPEVVAAPEVVAEVVAVDHGAGGRVGSSDRPATASSINNSRRAPGGAATIVLG